MKTSAVLASLFFGSFAIAAPVDKRALVFHTKIVTETVVVYTTIYDDDVPAATTSAVVESPTAVASASAYTSSAKVEEPSSIYTPTQTPTPTPTPAAQSTSEQPKPTTTEQAAVSVASSAAPVAASSAAAKVESKATTTGQTYSDVDITIYDISAGNTGACGTVLSETDMVVALAKGTWGESTHDVMTGKSTNPWCGQKIQIDYNGNSIEATIVDMCPGCTGSTDIDLSYGAWQKLTGLTEKTRKKASWSKIS